MSHPRTWRSRGRDAGFTLAEAIVVIVVAAIIAAVVAVFIRLPVQGYLESAGRAQLTDAADTALRRMVRDLRGALPNSVRTLAPCGVATACLEFIPAVTGGRYRAERNVAGDDPLEFTVIDTSFEVLGPAVTVPAGSWLVVYNLGIAGGADAYEGATLATHNRRAATPAASTSNISITSTARLPHDSPARRFHVVQQPVTYRCDLASGLLTRTTAYGFNPAQVNPAGGMEAVLTDRVTGCTFEYSAVSVARRAGSVLVALQLTQNSETVSLAMQAHVSNVP